jgi:hypothetical protein
MNRGQKERTEILLKKQTLQRKVLLQRSLQFVSFYKNNTEKPLLLQIAHKHNTFRDLEIKSLPSSMNTNKINYNTILHYFYNKTQCWRNLLMLK